ncbi:MAG TPA: hypothetical protein VFP98_03140, partial [Candidatus Polarisedimenticolia bacterium]|nr:hypothetical protein [Candidatus Polarisedimenticolia bacterium]
RCNPLTGACLNPAVSCDDGNPCTLDSCSNGACLAEELFGVACDDGNLCTVDERCGRDAAGTPVCLGNPLDCNDNDICTADICDPAFGTCLTPPDPISSATGLLFVSDTMMAWDPVSATSIFNTYRGTIPSTLMSSSGGGYNHGCYESGDAFGDGEMMSTDAAVPMLGTAFYYAVTNETSCGESPPCLDDDGTPCPLPSPCPTPP